MEIITTSEKETQKTAEDIAPSLRSSDVVLLYGTLGMGKTVFARALIRALTANPALEVPSPTFTLLQTYDGQNAPIYHYDLYRIENEEEIIELDWEDAIAGSITIVEWPERLGSFKPRSRLDITLKNVENNPNSRQILIEKID